MRMTKTDVVAQEVVLVKTHELINSPWNPPHRTSMKNIKKLADSISRVGMLMPIFLDVHKQIIDGHRRRAAARSLEILNIPAIIADFGADHAYAEVNTEVRRLTGADALSVWLNTKTAVSPSKAREFVRIAGVLGIDRMRLLAKHKLTTNIYTTAKLILSAFDAIKHPVVDVVDWLIDHRDNKMSSALKMAVWFGEDVYGRVIARAITKNVPVELVFKK